jgi:hypothetical protein
MNLDTTLTVPPQVMSRMVGDETVLLDLASGLYFGLDGVGQRIWQAVADGKKLSETIDIIVAEYDVDQNQATADVLQFASTLLERGLLSE